MAANELGRLAWHHPDVMQKPFMTSSNRPTLSSTLQNASMSLQAAVTYFSNGGAHSTSNLASSPGDSGQLPLLPCLKVLTVFSFIIISVDIAFIMPWLS